MPLFSLSDLNLEQLSNPLSGDNPAGSDLRTDKSSESTYYQIRELRNKARNFERENISNLDQVGFANNYWQEIAQLSVKSLTEHTKDLEISAWLIESLVRIHGFKGLNKGFAIAKNLIQNFWEQLYPTIDEEGVATRVSALSGLNGVESKGTLIAPILMIPITEGKNLRPYAEWHYEQALEINAISDPEKKQRRLDNGAVSLEMIMSDAHESGSHFFQELHTDLQESIKQYQELDSLLMQNCGTDAPPTSNIKEALNKCLDSLLFIAKDKLTINSIDFTNSESPDTTIHLITPAQPGPTQSHIRDRAQAFKTLEDIADFFLKTEPHSPIAYNIKQIIRWGNMPLPQLLNHLIPDEHARTNFCLLSGVPLNRVE